ncbi:MAG TPA: efflux transporter outer membrane subunit [Steroidobacteraceae bacterium]|jgi:NodT family efflux transporter outer membrane factor (OMF) lipoprotein
MNTRNLLGEVGVALLLSGCTVGPNYEPPRAPDVQAWRAAPAQGELAITRSNPDPKWWLAFDDPILAELIDRGIAGNLDIQQAVLRVVEARQGIVAARAAGLPTLGGTASYQREQLGVKGILESQGVYKDLNELADRLQPYNAAVPGLSTSGVSGARQALNRFTSPVNVYQYGLDSSWELDLFGRVRRSVEQARARAQGQSEALNDGLIVLESEIVQSYVQLRGAQALKASQEENVRAATVSLELAERRQRSGLTTELDVDQARTQLDDTRRQLPSFEKQIQQAMNALSVLTGQNPGALDAELRGVRPLPRIPAAVGIGVPSTLARRRPDIREAEANLHAATAGVGVAVASFYPDISLTGSIGIRALDASYLTNWASHFYSAGPSISLPIFSGGRLASNLTLARAQAQEAALNYRGTVLNALREVEDTLIAYRTDRDSRDQLEDTLRAAETTWSLAQSQYANGLTSFIQVLDSERTVLSDRQALVQADMQIANDIVALYRALGGGWEQSAGEVQAPEVSSAPPVTPAALDRIGAAVSNNQTVDP